MKEQLTLSYTPEQVEEMISALNQGAPVLVEPKNLRKALEMLRAYTATPSQPETKDHD